MGWDDDVPPTLDAGQTVSTVGPLTLLVLDAEGLERKLLPSSGHLSLGRDPRSQVLLRDLRASREHARLHLGHQIELEDLSSANGTFLEGQRLAPGQRARFTEGQVATIGDVVLTLRRGVASDPRVVSGSDAVVCTDPVMLELRQGLERLAKGTVAVLLTGETGVGKEVFARQLHERSARRAKPFVEINCAAFADNLFESELFGHDKGAFTGADRDKLGLIESAQDGTLFLDEVGELPKSAQAKLLKVLESGELLRVGSVRPRKIDVRFVAATNRPLQAAIDEGRFRADLYFRLAAAELAIPPLRERSSEILPLARHFLERAGRELGRSTPLSLSPAAEAALLRHLWPGNVRELRNVIDRGALYCTGSVIDESHLKLASVVPTAPSSARPTMVPSGATATDDERERIMSALAQSGGNQTKAARLLGISRRTLTSRLSQYNLPRPRK